MVSVMLLSACGILTVVSIKTTYWILRFFAGVAWFGLMAWWLANPFAAADSPTNNIAILLTMGMGLAMMFMVFWYTDKEGNGGRFRLRFWSREDEGEENGERVGSTRQERNDDYRDRLRSASNGEIRRRRY